MRSQVVIKRILFFLFVIFFFVSNTPAQDTLLDPAEVPPQEPPYTSAPMEPYIEPQIYDPLAETQVSEEAGGPEERPVRKIEDVVVRDLIEKKANGTYIYKFERKSTDRRTGHFKAGLMSPPAISALIGGQYKLTFKEMYSESPVPFFTYEREWTLFEQWSGLRAQAGVGAFFSQGKGRFARDVQDYDGQPTNIAKERYSFFGLPLSAGLILRLQFPNSWFAPFANGGLTYTGLAEIRDDSAKRTFLGAPSIYAGGGGMLNLTSLDRNASFTFDRDYSIRHLWLTAEARWVRSFSQDLDTSATIVFLGLAADY